jgi:hypothetical protein
MWTRKGDAELRRGHNVWRLDDNLEGQNGIQIIRMDFIGSWKHEYSNESNLGLRRRS